MGNVLAHLRSNAVAYLALFVALGGSAYAAAKIDSGDVQNNSLISGDLKNGKAVKGADVKPDTLGGAQINESSLEQLAVAASDKDGNVVALDTVGVYVSEVTLEIPSSGQLFATATVDLIGDGGNDDRPRCDIQLEKSGESNTTISAGSHRITIADTAADESSLALSGAAGVSPGTYTARLECDVATSGAATAANRELLIWSIPD
jgi:hypothetical protein